MGLKNQDLSVALLNKLTALEELDLSGNMLQKLPAGLFLPHLRLLNFSSNDMEDVTSLEALTGLQELRLDDNLYLTVRPMTLTCSLKDSMLLLLFVWFLSFQNCFVSVGQRWAQSHVPLAPIEVPEWEGHQCDGQPRSLREQWDP